MMTLSSILGVKSVKTGFMDVVLVFCNQAENIEEYVCPRCEPSSRLNYPNLKKLNSKDHELIKKTFKAIQNNRNSQPFKEPVNPNVNPKYYEIVKEPMDLQTIEGRVNYNQYNCLAEFIGD